MPLPFALTESPASFPTGWLGRKHESGGKEYVACKNTDGAALSPGMVVTLEAAATFAVDTCAANETIYGVVANELTGTTVAVSDIFWVQRKGTCYALYSGSASSAIASTQILIAAGTAGYVEGQGDVTYGAASFKANLGLETSRLVAGNQTVTTNTAAGTQVKAVLL